MSAYTCIKPATFAGVKYKPGDSIPAEAIPADRVGAVIRMGLIAEQADGLRAEQQPEQQPERPDSVGTFTVPIVFDSGDVEQLPVTPATVEEAVSVLQMTADGATKHIAGMTDDAALILIDACDSRKTVKAAAKARAKAIEDAAKTPGQTTEEEAETPGQTTEDAAEIVE